MQTWRWSLHSSRLLIRLSLETSLETVLTHTALSLPMVHPQPRFKHLQPSPLPACIAVGMKLRLQDLGCTARGCSTCVCRNVGSNIVSMLLKSRATVRPGDSPHSHSSQPADGASPAPAHATPPITLPTAGMNFNLLQGSRCMACACSTCIQSNVNSDIVSTLG